MSIKQYFRSLSALQVATFLTAIGIWSCHHSITLLIGMSVNAFFTCGASFWQYASDLHTPDREQWWIKRIFGKSYPLEFSCQFGVCIMFLLTAQYLWWPIFFMAGFHLMWLVTVAWEWMMKRYVR